VITTKTGCAICGGSVVASWVAENNELIIGVSGIVGIVVAVVGLWFQYRRDRRETRKR
jgi:hypothetical protein